MYSLARKGDSLSLKIVKKVEEPEADKTKKQFVKTEEGSTTNIKIEENQAGNNKPSDTTHNQAAKKFEEPLMMMRSKSDIISSIFQGKNPASFSDLVAGLGLPAEVEEVLNNSKIFNNFQMSATRKIGNLTVEERRIKVEKYLEKRKKRTWCKKINYDCRKRVADSRLRFKGRFVTKTQAFAMLEEEGIYPDPNKITEQEIKDLLEQKFGNDLPPKKKPEKEVDGRKNNGKTKKQKKSEGNRNKDEKDWLIRYGLEKDDDLLKSPTDSCYDEF